MTFAVDGRHPASFAQEEEGRIQNRYGGIGSETETDALANLLALKLQNMRNKHAITLEYLRMGALKGVILDADGSTLYNLYTEFGIAAKTVGFALAGGALLAMDGLRRGGWAGVGETTAGGTLIGAKFGGPLGAAIGAGVGFLAGMVRLFVKGATEKAREKIKNLYGVDIPDKGVLQQIVDIAKQSYGGNLDMAIRTQQVRDLIQLYAMSTGQQTKEMPAQVHPLDIVQQGGSLYQSPGYSNGTVLPGLGGLPTLDSIGGGVASGAQPVVIRLDGPAITSFLRGEAVNAIASNPRAVAGASMSAARSNAGRRELTSLQLSPGLLTA